MSQLIACYKNLLESATVTLSAGTEDSNYPLYRLYDRDPGLKFKPTSAVTIEIKIDQSGLSSKLAVDRLLIPPGHNLSGMTLDIKHSSDDITYIAAVAQWSQPDNNEIVKSWSSLTKDYWKFIITSPASIPEIGDMFLSPSYTWERNPARPTGPLDLKFNVERREDAGGRPRYLQHGNPRRQRSYQLPRAVSAQRTNIEDLNTVWAGSRPFWICDHESNWIFGELISPIELIEVAYNKYAFKFDFLEVLAA